ncbi:hypothetical protein AVEN_2957-1 [Araneus ventricosus]|uniref:Uncharacterized protein n=1 Tax=Araneus ventricosus TaxID=182803 RepID=A0A4Y2PRJ1_ARAVE|nr:hypothetical protein AVEN_2957-1 [Araneus ventricosus]
MNDTEFLKVRFLEELVDGTLFEESETRWILEESPERTTKAVLSSLEDDGLKRGAKQNVELGKRNLPTPKKKGCRGRGEDAGWTDEIWLVLNSLVAGGRGCSVIAVAICENAGREFGSKAMHSTERRLLKEGTSGSVLP